MADFTKTDAFLVGLPGKLTVDDVDNADNLSGGLVSTDDLLARAADFARNFVGDFSYMQDMRAKVVSGAGLSLGMAKGVLNCLRADLNRSASRNGSNGSSDSETVWVPAPSGNLTVTGEVLTTKFVENRFGGTMKMLLRVGDPAIGAWKLWVTVSRSLGSVAPGDTVTLTADVSVGDRDASFAFGSRPTGARKVRGATSVAPSPSTVPTAPSGGTPGVAAPDSRRFNEAGFRSQFIRLASELSPENLYCDGEISEAQARAKERRLLAAWAKLEDEYGRGVSEDEVWRWAIDPPT